MPPITRPPFVVERVQREYLDRMGGEIVFPTGADFTHIIKHLQYRRAPSAMFPAAAPQLPTDTRLDPESCSRP